MNKENQRKLWLIIQEAGDYLAGRLPDHPNHPRGRNPYAHVAICVKDKFNASYKDIPDEKIDEIRRGASIEEVDVNINPKLKPVD